MLNPGFMETNAKLTTAQRESVEETPKIRGEASHASKEGEQIMTLDMDKYVQKA